MTTPILTEVPAGRIFVGGAWVSKASDRSFPTWRYSNFRTIFTVASTGHHLERRAAAYGQGGIFPVTG